MNLPKNVHLNEVSFHQEGDTCSNGDEQYLDVKLEDSGAGYYYVISTDRWAFDSIEELVMLLENLKLTIPEESATIDIHQWEE